MVIGENLNIIRQRIDRAAVAVGRDPDDVRLVAISKTHSCESIQEAFNCGQNIFGESRIQEAESKIETLSQKISWHLVGHLQRNKVRQAVKVFDLIHSVDSIRLLQEISKRAEEIGKVQDILIQVDVSGEESKFGLSRDKLPDFIEAAVNSLGVRLCGLMTMPPFFHDPEEARLFFRDLKAISLKLDRYGWPETGTTELSMGMSHDFEVAIAEGSTLVRVGTAIFGRRDLGGLK